MQLRRKPVPPQVRQALPPRSGDKLLAHATLADGGWVVATRSALGVVGQKAQLATRRPWCDVHTAKFDPETRTVEVQWVNAVEPEEFVFADDKDAAPFLLTLRERVQASVVIADVVDVGDERNVRVAVRKDADGQLFSQVVADGGVQLDDPDVAALVEDTESRLRSASGLVP